MFKVLRLPHVSHHPRHCGLPLSPPPAGHLSPTAHPRQRPYIAPSSSNDMPDNVKVCCVYGVLLLTSHPSSAVVPAYPQRVGPYSPPLFLSLFPTRFSYSSLFVLLLDWLSFCFPSLPIASFPFLSLPLSRDPVLPIDLPPVRSFGDFSTNCYFSLLNLLCFLSISIPSRFLFPPPRPPVSCYPILRL